MLTAIDICRITGKKKAAVSLFLSRNTVEYRYNNGKSKYYDESAEPLASYMRGGGESAEKAGRKTAVEPEMAGADVTPKDTRDKSAARRRVDGGDDLALNAVFSGKKGDDAPAGAKMLAMAYNEAKEAEDYGTKIRIASMLIKEHDAARLREHERIIFEAKQRKAEAEAEKVKIENAMRRGELVRRDAVKREWGRMCGIIVSQIHPVGIKIAPQVCALLGATDTEKRLSVQALIDGEIYAACENVRRELGVID